MNILIILCSFLVNVSALLYPIDSETRTKKVLDGLWDFVREEANSKGYGFSNDWYNLKLSTFEVRTLSKLHLNLTKKLKNVTKMK